MNLFRLNMRKISYGMQAFLIFLTTTLAKLINMTNTGATEAQGTPTSKAIKKAPKTKIPKKLFTHPKYSVMILQAINALKEKSGSSSHAIIKYIVTNFQADWKKVATQFKLSIKRLKEAGTLKQVKRSFRLTKTDNDKPKKATKKISAKKPAVKKEKKATAKNAAEKKTPKKSAKKTIVAKKNRTKKPKAVKKPQRNPHQRRLRNLRIMPLKRQKSN
ncbi:Histone H1.0-A [Armadillidium nasatum]|uniref:Histone H1.0-A n=1 Tax=Armadillidium nasatum TaxID=96803 RepID=A0A5N5SPG9_9CRUS|nr:Histone H1.0-A [Armadillidium nasatum]